MSLFNTFEKRVNNPSVELVNFESIVSQPITKYEIWQRYKFDVIFRHSVDEMRNLSSSFNYKWNKYFSLFHEREYNNLSEEKPKIKANVRKFN